MLFRSLAEVQRLLSPSAPLSPTLFSRVAGGEGEDGGATNTSAPPPITLATVTGEPLGMVLSASVRVPSGRPCPVCDASRWREGSARLGFPLLRCAECGLGMQHPQPPAAVLARIYGQEYYRAWGLEKEEAAVRQQKLATFAMRLRRLGPLPQGARILDCGAATGHLMEAARRQANEFTRLDGRRDETHSQRWAARLPMSAALREQLPAMISSYQEQVLAERGDNFQPANKNHQHQVFRQAARRALLDLGLLTITRRSIPLPLKRKKRAKISERAHEL